MGLGVVGRCRRWGCRGWSATGARGAGARGRCFRWTADRLRFAPVFLRGGEASRRMHNNDALPIRMPQRVKTRECEMHEVGKAFRQGWHMRRQELEAGSYGWKTTIRGDVFRSESDGGVEPSTVVRIIGRREDRRRDRQWRIHRAADKG